MRNYLLVHQDYFKHHGVFDDLLTSRQEVIRGSWSQIETNLLDESSEEYMRLIKEIEQSFISMVLVE